MFSPLLQIIIPFFLSALIVIIVMYIAEKYGSKAGGILGTLPSTIIVAFIFIALNQGTDFASKAAAVVPAELGFNVIFLLIIALFIHRSIPLTFILAFIVWTICSLLLIIFQMDNIYISLAIYLIIVLFSFLYLEHKKQIPSIGSVKVHYTFNKILFRGILAGMIIALAVFLSNIGSIISGIFSVFPAILFSTMIISVREHGPNFTAGLAKSMLLGLSSVATYATVIHFLYPIYDIILGSISAFILSFFVTLSIYKIRNKIK